MNVIYFFIILAIVNIAMFLLLTQCLGYYKNKSESIKGVIIITSCLIFTIISALIYSGMVGWNCVQENYEWNLDKGFRVSSIRQQCMNEGVCRVFKNSSKDSQGVLVGNTQKNTCLVPTPPGTKRGPQTNMTTLNFPPRLSKNCMSNPDSENYGSGCHKWTVGSNGNPNFPMTYSNWINDPHMSNPIGWPRPDATAGSISYVPPTSSCVNQIRPQPPNINYSIPWDTYSTLSDYAKPRPIQFKLPMPGASPRFPACCDENETKEKYVPMFLNCLNKKYKKFS